MKSLNNTILIISFCFVFLTFFCSFSQNKRQIKPKRNSQIESADVFTNITYKLYNKVYIHDSLTQVGIEIPGDLEEELIERAKSDIDSLIQVFPDVIDDIANSNTSIIKKARATLNLNKSKKALKYCGLYIKQKLIGIKNEDE